MKKYIVLVFFLLLTACSEQIQVPTLAEPTPDQKLNMTEAGLSLSISKQDYVENSPTFNTTLNNKSEISYEYGEYYHIEIFKDNNWYIVTHSDAVFLDDPNFTNLGHLISPEEEVNQTFSVTKLNLTLVPGEYRLVKIFMKPQEPFYTVTLAVPFTVE